MELFQIDLFVYGSKRNCHRQDISNEKAFFFPCELSEGSYDELACMLTDTNHPVENCIVYIVLTNARYFPV